MNKIIEILDSEKAIHEELLNLAKEKKEILIKNDIDSLNSIVKRESELVNNIKELEEKREDSVQVISKEIGVGAENLTLSEMAKHAIGIQKNKLLQLKDELSEVVKQLSDYNDINKELLATHLNYTFFSLNIMAQGVTPVDTYDNSGYMKDDNKVRIGLIDQKA